jgi:hypothetical protein
MLQLYDYLDEMLAASRFSVNASRLPYLASEILTEIGCEDEQSVELALRRAFQACRSLGFPIGDHFGRVFMYNGERLLTDWKLSPLGCYLLVINGNPCHPSVARAQIYMRQII